MPRLVPLGAAAALTALGLLAAPGPAPAAAAASPGRVCAQPRPGAAACHAVRGTGGGLTPAQLRSAYKLPSRGGRTQTIGIVVAYDAPSVEQDLKVYRRQFRLPPCAAADRCFRKVNGRGRPSGLPRPNASWATEAALDTQVAAAICPQCRILLVEADNDNLATLAAAVDTAVRLGATVVSNSYGGPEDPRYRSIADSYRHPAVAMTASTGDYGYEVDFPAATPWVTAVGGTVLQEAHNARGWTETAWRGSGSGCSAYFPKPAWQHDKACPRRAVADVAAVAEPGALVYDSYRSSGWQTVGGTSVSAPLIAGIYALAGGVAPGTYGASPYRHRSRLFDVTSGRTGSCGGSYLCIAGRGYDGPTGLGTPNGVAAF